MLWRIFKMHQLILLHLQIMHIKCWNRYMVRLGAREVYAKLGQLALASLDTTKQMVMILFVLHNSRWPKLVRVSESQHRIAHVFTKLFYQFKLALSHLLFTKIMCWHFLLQLKVTMVKCLWNRYMISLGKGRLC